MISDPVRSSASLSSPQLPVLMLYSLSPPVLPGYLSHHVTKIPDKQLEGEKLCIGFWEFWKLPPAGAGEL